MGIYQQLVGVIVVVEAGLDGGSGRQDTHASKDKQGQDADMLSKGPAPDHNQPARAAKQRDDETGEELAGGLQLDQRFSCEGRVGSQQRSKRSCHTDGEDRQNQQRQPATLFPQQAPVGGVDGATQEPGGA